MIKHSNFGFELWLGMDCTTKNAKTCEEGSEKRNGPSILRKMGSDSHDCVRAEQQVITQDGCKWSSHSAEEMILNVTVTRWMCRNF